MRNLIKMELELRELQAKENDLYKSSNLEKMAKLENDIVEEIERLANSKYHTQSINKNILDTIIIDYGIEALEMDWRLYTYDEYIEIYEVFQTDKERSLYYFDLNNGKDWLQANELDGVEHLVYTRDYIAIATNY